MSEPIMFITTMQIHKGKLQEFKDEVKKEMAFLEANGPQLMAEVYVDQDNMLAHGVQIHRDSESILSHWQISRTYMQAVMQHIKTTRVDIFGQPNETVMEGMRRLSGMGATVAVKPHLAGFNRFQASGSA